LRNAAKWAGTVFCALIVLASIACALWGRVTVATGLFSEVGIRGGAIVTFSWHGADWPPAEYWAIERERTIRDWADEWAGDGIWPSWGQDGHERWTIVPLWIPFVIIFPVTIWLWRDERKWIVVAIVAFAACCVGTRVASRYFYDAYWPGHPDSFRAETAMLPGLSFHHFGDFFWQDRQQALIFLSACAAYALPPFVGLALARGRELVALVPLTSILLAGAATWEVWERWDSYVRVFSTPATGSVFIIEKAWRDVAWVVGLTIGGLLIGYAIRLVVPRHPFRVGRCRACGYDLRVQSALGIPRCPECGALAAGGSESAR
jgi:hypothetical protein